MCICMYLTVHTGEQVLGSYWLQEVNGMQGAIKSAELQPLEHASLGHIHIKKAIKKAKS